MGSPNVQNMNFTSNTVQDPVAGRLLVSDDKCVRIKMNTVNLYGGRDGVPGGPLSQQHLHEHVRGHLWCAEIWTAQVCSCLLKMFSLLPQTFYKALRKLSKELIDPDSDKNLFKTPLEPELWKDLC